MEGGASGSPGQCLWSSGRSAQQVAGELGGGLGFCPVYGSPGWWWGGSTSHLYFKEYKVGFVRKQVMGFLFTCGEDLISEVWRKGTRERCKGKEHS